MSNSFAVWDLEFSMNKPSHIRSDEKLATTSKAVSLSPSPATGPRKGKAVGAVVNASRVLRYLQAVKEPVTAVQVTRDLKLNPSTCFNILRTLIDEDFVEFDEPSKTYTLSLGLVALARGALEQSVELKILQPKLQGFARTHSVMAAIIRRINADRCAIVAVAESDAPIRIQARIGTLSPLLLGAAGRVFAAYSRFSEVELEDRFNKLRLARELDFDMFKRQVAKVLTTGWARDDGYYHAGTVSVAAPVFDPLGEVSLCCSAIMFNGQFTAHRITAIAEELAAIGKCVVGMAQHSGISQPQPVAARED
jgi:DNA-binding IclR family transcriptional regulator